METSSVMQENKMTFENAVRMMREYQKRYFRSRSQSDLAEAKKWEQAVDRALADMQQGSLF